MANNIRIVMIVNGQNIILEKNKKIRKNIWNERWKKKKKEEMMYDFATYEMSVELKNSSIINI